MIPTSIDGTDITGATIDGTDVQEITVDGQTVFTAGPDIPGSAVFNIKAQNYDDANNKYVSTIGPDLPDVQGNPSTTIVTIGGQNFTVVRYNRGNSDASQTTTQIATGDPIALVYSVAMRDPNTAPQHYLDTDSKDNFAHLLDSRAGDPHRILSNQYGVSVRGDDADSAFHTFAYVIGTVNGGTLDRDGTNILSDGSASDPSLDGFTLGARGDLQNHSGLDVLEVTALDSPSTSDISQEVSRQRGVYNI